MIYVSKLIYFSILSHRHAQDHDCSKLKEELMNTGSKTAEHVNQIIGKLFIVYQIIGKLFTVYQIIGKLFIVSKL
jgi:hypothetical protein